MIKGLSRSLKRFVSRVKQHLKQWSQARNRQHRSGVNLRPEAQLQGSDPLECHAVTTLIVLNRQVKRPQLTQGDRLSLVLLARMMEFWQQALPSSRTRCCAGIATCSAAIGRANRSPRSASRASHLKPSS